MLSTDNSKAYLAVANRATYESGSKWDAADSREYTPIHPTPALPIFGGWLHSLASVASVTQKKNLRSRELSVEEITARANPPPTVVHRRLSLEFRPDGTRYVVTNKQVDLGLVRAPEHLD